MTVSPSFPLSVSPSPAVVSGAPAFNFPGWRPSPSPSGPVPVNMLGVPFDRVSTADTLAAIGRMIESRRPHFIATANVDFLVQARADRELRRILCEADLVLCDGTPLVWASRWLGNALPERVAGSDLVSPLLATAERRGWRVFLLGGTDASLDRAAANVRARHPDLALDSFSPPFRPLLEMDHDDIVRRVRAARPDILLVAFGCPKQEKWIRMHLRDLGVPVCIGVGATIDFLAGTVRRAPVWMRRAGMEWLFRLGQEPRRLAGRYLAGLAVFSRGIAGQWWSLRRRSGRKDSPTAEPVRVSERGTVHWQGGLDAASVGRLENPLGLFGNHRSPGLLDLSAVDHVDSTGIGFLVRLRKELGARWRELVLVAPSAAVTAALEHLGCSDLFPVAADELSALRGLRERRSEPCVAPAAGAGSAPEALVWQGEITAANEDEVWQRTCDFLTPGAVRAQEVEVSLAGVRFIDSAGVRLMVRARKAAVARGLRLRFIAPSPAVSNVLCLLRMERHLLS